MKKLILSMLLMINLSHAETLEELQQQVWAAETAFAQTMADRDLSAFSAFLAPDTVFFSENATHRGKDAVTKAWGAFFEAEQAPFAWKPEQVEVLYQFHYIFSLSAQPQGH